MAEPTTSYLELLDAAAELQGAVRRRAEKAGFDHGPAAEAELAALTDAARALRHAVAHLSEARRRCVAP